MDSKTDLLIVGAGPFGLALAAHAGDLGIEHIIVGEPMDFWRSHMPPGMFLRSGTDWHLDVAGAATLEAYASSLGRTAKDVEPLSLAFYLDYVRWFQEQKRLTVHRTIVERLERADRNFAASTSDGSTIAARRVVLALGFAHFAHVPAQTAALLPEGRYAHTCDAVDLHRFAGRRVLIVGGRQSAFEWAALLREAGAVSVALTYRHDTPAFAPSDWTWVTPLVESIADDPGAFRRLTDDEKATLNRRLWVEGRSKLEPWLAPRITADNVRLWPGTTITACHARSGAMEVTLDPAGSVTADDVIFATGYKVDLTRVPMLRMLLASIDCRDGAPLLSEHFETSVPGLYMTSMAATRDFGSFFAFTVSARASARIIAADVQRSLAG